VPISVLSNAIRGGDARAGAELVGEPAPVARLGQRDVAPLGEGVVGGHREAELLPVQGVPGEVLVGRAGCGQPEVHAACTHVLGDLVTGGLGELERHGGRRRAVAAQQVRGEPHGDRVQERQPHGAALRIAQRADPLLGGGQLGQAAPGVLQHDLAGRVEPQPPVDPVEQRRAHLPFQAPQRAGERGLGHGQPLGGLRHVLGLGERDEPLQLVHGGHAPIMLAARRGPLSGSRRWR
jgi:hypothetical protein